MIRYSLNYIFPENVELIQIWLNRAGIYGNWLWLGT